MRLRDRGGINPPKKLDEEPSSPSTISSRSHKKLRPTSVPYNPSLPPAVFPSVEKSFVSNEKVSGEEELLFSDDDVPGIFSLLTANEVPKTVDSNDCTKEQFEHSKRHPQSRLPSGEHQSPDVAAIEEVEHLGYYQTLVDDNAWETGSAFRNDRDGSTLLSHYAQPLGSIDGHGLSRITSSYDEPLLFTRQGSEDFEAAMGDSDNGDAVVQLLEDPTWDPDEILFAPSWDNLSTAIKVSIFESLVIDLRQRNMGDVTGEAIGMLKIDAEQYGELDKLIEKKIRLAKEDDEKSIDFLGRHAEALTDGWASFEVTSKLLEKQRQRRGEHSRASGPEMEIEDSLSTGKQIDEVDTLGFDFVKVSEKGTGIAFLKSMHLSEAYLDNWATAKCGEAISPQTGDDIKVYVEQRDKKKEKDEAAKEKKKGTRKSRSSGPLQEESDTHSPDESKHDQLAHDSAAREESRDCRLRKKTETDTARMHNSSGIDPGAPVRQPVRRGRRSRKHSGLQTSSTLSDSVVPGESVTELAETSFQVLDEVRAPRTSIKSRVLAFGDHDMESSRENDGRPVELAGNEFQNHEEASMSETGNLNNVAAENASRYQYSLSKSHQTSHRRSDSELDRALREDGSPPLDLIAIGLEAQKGIRPREDSGSQAVEPDQCSTKRKRKLSDKVLQNLANEGVKWPHVIAKSKAAKEVQIMMPEKLPASQVWDNIGQVDVDGIKTLFDKPEKSSAAVEDVPATPSKTGSRRAQVKTRSAPSTAERSATESEGRRESGRQQYWRELAYNAGLGPATSVEARSAAADPHNGTQVSKSIADEASSEASMVDPPNETKSGDNLYDTSLQPVFGVEPARERGPFIDKNATPVSTSKHVTLNIGGAKSLKKKGSKKVSSHLSAK